MVYRRRDRKGWWFKYIDPATGNRNQKLGGHTKRKAEVARVEFIKALGGQIRPKLHDDLEQFLTKYYWPAQMNHLSEKGIQRELGILNKHLGPYFAGPMIEITREKIVSYVHQRLNPPKVEEPELKDKRRRIQKASKETIRKELVILKHALRLATKQGFLERNPFDDLEPKDWPKKGEERTRHLVGDEWERLLTHVPEEMRAAVMILVNTGCRRGELMNLKHSDVNLDSRIAYLGKTKTGKNRWMPLTPDVVQLIKGLPRRVGDHRVFPFFTPNALSVAVKRAIRKAKIPDFRLHDLRHTFATDLRKDGFGLDVIAKLLGHSDLRQTKRYAHLGDELLVEAVRSLEGKYTIN